MNPDDRKRLALSLEHAKPDVVVMDSCSDMLAQAALDEDSNSDITDWYHSFVTPLAQHGATVVIIDHVTKARDNRGTYARGAGAKKAKADVAWAVNVEERFALDPPRLGRIALTINKDRLGRLPGRVAYSIGATSDGNTRVRRLGDGTKVVSASQRIRTNITNMLLERTGDPDNAMPTSEVSKIIEGKDVLIRQVLNKLAQDEESPVTYYTQTASETATKYWWAEDSGSVIEIDFS